MTLYPRTDAHRDPRAAAHRILDSWRAGMDFPPQLIEWALHQTGDLE